VFGGRVCFAADRAMAHGRGIRCLPGRGEEIKTKEGSEASMGLFLHIDKWIFLLYGQDMMTAKTLLPIGFSLCFGFFLSAVFFMSLFVVSLDGAYLKMGSFVHIRDGFEGWVVWPGDAPGWEHPLLSGKTVVGYGGFPVSRFKECVLYGLRSDLISRPLYIRCETASVWGWGAFGVDFIFWTLFCLGISRAGGSFLHRKKREKNEGDFQKTEIS
jgi:hypothetical protein